MKCGGAYSSRRTPFVAATSLGNCRNLRQFVRQPNPLGDMLVALKRRQFRAVQVLGDFHHASAGCVNVDKRALDTLYAEALARLDTMTAGDEDPL